MECSCAGSGSADNPALNFCFKDCDFKAGDTCYISTGMLEWFPLWLVYHKYNKKIHIVYTLVTSNDPNAYVFFVVAVI